MLTPNVNLTGKTVLVTGAAGFIGANLVLRLMKEEKNVKIVGIDNMNDYYDVSIKEYRLGEIESCAAKNPSCEWIFVRGNIADRALIDSLFAEHKFAVVVNLAAQAGVRYSITNPDVYIESNIIGFYNILEACRSYPVEHLVYASSSSVYGSNKKVPYSTEDKVDNPVSLYAATKSFTIFHRPDFASSPFTVLRDVPIWRTSALLISSFKTRLSRYSITEIVNATLHLLMIS